MRRKYIKIDKIIKNSIKNGEILGITSNINKVKNNYIYVCIKGINYDAHSNINEAFLKGAKYVIGEEKFNLKNYFIVNNSRKVLSYLLNIFYNYPDKKLDIIGVVGTNGKTSTTYIFKDYAKQYSLNCGVIGTNGIYINNRYYKSKLTTPDSEELYYYLDKMVKNNVKYVIMELSAHAIYFNKFFSINFYGLVFTNFSQDHLDFFKTMENYKCVKKSIFANYNYKVAVINIDDKVGKEIFLEIPENKLKISFGENGIINVKDNKIIINNEIMPFKNPLKPRYNDYNFMAVFSLFLSFKKYSVADLVKKGEKIKQLKGRFEVINFRKTHKIVIDYAHTPQAIKETLSWIKIYYPNNYIITMFGCPGNRDQSKRQIIGEIVNRYSNFVIVTSDNPQFENPIKIMKQICKSKSKKRLLIEDREKALKKGLEILQNTPFSILVLLGKGIETYQMVNNIKIPYNERKLIKTM